MGHPIRVCELLSTLATPAYIERVTVVDPKSIINAKKALKKAFTYQLEGRGYTFIEVVSTCPTGWGLTPVKAGEWVKETMLSYYKLGCFKDYK